MEIKLTRFSYGPARSWFDHIIIGSTLLKTRTNVFYFRPNGEMITYNQLLDEQDKLWFRSQSRRILERNEW